MTLKATDMKESGAFLELMNMNLNWGCIRPAFEYGKQFLNCPRS